MSSPSDQSPYHMAKFDEKKVAEVQRNLMAPGSGTPWEDRGAIGAVAGFIKTLFMSMFVPIRLVNRMRRPEISTDVTRFALGCGIFWGAAIVVSSWLALGPIQSAKLYDEKHPVPKYGDPNQPRYEVDAHWYWGGAAVMAIVDVALTVATLKVAANVLEKLISHDMPQRAPSVLYFNLMGYSLGPSLLAPIPFYGWLAALLWIFLNWLLVAKSRLDAKIAATLIAVILTSIAVFCFVFALDYVELLAIQHFAVTDQRTS
ncbi:MAG TPA: hypothetical protein VMD30_07145 [Tepidisphaeraceae bacterium]|nr:hypothetical protein [Tepidisphaeraceae bacterium]